LRPVAFRDDRAFAGFFMNGESKDGGRDEFDESAPSRRSNSATLAVSFSIDSVWAAMTSACDATSSTNSWYVGSAPQTHYCNHSRIKRETPTNPGE